MTATDQPHPTPVPATWPCATCRHLRPGRYQPWCDADEDEDRDPTATDQCPDRETA